MELSKHEWAAIVAIIRDAEKKHGEDAIGVILKTSGGKFLTNPDVLALAKKIDETNLDWHREGWPEGPPYEAVRRDGKKNEPVVPENWQALHQCSSFAADLDGAGRCLFCRQNAPDGPFGSKGYEVIPFDVPGVYDPKGEPNVLIRERPKPS